MAEVLRAPLFDIAPVRLRGPTEMGVDAAAALDSSWQDGHLAGWHEGRAAGRAEVAEFAAQMAAAVDRAVIGYAATCAQTRAELGTSLVDLAQALVEGVLGHLPDTATKGVLERLQAALELIEDGPLTVLVHPSTMELLEPVLEMRAGGHPVQPRADARLAPGELVIEGPWVFAELTWPRLLDAARTTLTEMRDADQDESFADGTEPGARL